MEFRCVNTNSPEGDVKLRVLSCILFYLYLIYNSKNYIYIYIYIYIYTHKLSISITYICVYILSVKEIISQICLKTTSCLLDTQNKLLSRNIWSLILRLPAVTDISLSTSKSWACLELFDDHKNILVLE